MSITVTAVNDAPVCAPDTSSGNEDAGQSGTLSCTDVDDDPLTYSKVADPTDGGATVDPDGSWTYTPDPDFSGADSFTFRANDGTLDSSAATMTITVNGTNDAPSARPTPARAPRTRTRRAPSAAPTSTTTR